MLGPLSILPSSSYFSLSFLERSLSLLSLPELELSPFSTWSGSAIELPPNTHTSACVTLVFLRFLWYCLGVPAPYITVVCENLPEFALKNRSGTVELFIYLPIRRDGLSLFDDGDITWDDLAGLNFQLFPITNDLVCVKSLTKEDVRPRR